MTQQHYRLTLEKAIAHYADGLITASGLLYFYLKIRLAPGWKCTLHQREITEKLGISRAAFYKAIAKLSELGLIEFETPNGVTVTLSTKIDTSLRLKTESPIGDTSLQSETQFYKDRHQSLIGDTNLYLETQSLQIETPTPAKPSPVKASSPSSNSYQILINSLSDSAREKFLNFVKEKVKSFNPPINDIEAWLAGKNQAGKERSRVYYEMFQKEVGEGIAPSQDWENHPKRDEWIAQIRKGKGRFVAQGGPSEEWKMRSGFADWAIANHLIWENKP